jgi:integrase
MSRSQVRILPGAPGIAPGRDVAARRSQRRATRDATASSRGLDDLALEVLRKHPENVDRLADDLGVEVGPDAFMFSRSPAGLEPVRPDVLTKFTIRVAKKANVDTHLDALRHFSATQAIAAGFDAVTVGARLGHADPSVTLKVYSHAIESRDRDLAASLGKALTLPSPTQ